MKYNMTSIIVMMLFYFIITPTNYYAMAAPVISQQDGPPIILLPFKEGSEIYLSVYMDFDNTYTYNPGVKVYDLDGVSSVEFLFRPLDNNTWYPVTANLIEGNEFNGTYRGPFTWFKTGVEFKVTATDTFGLTNTTDSIFYLIDPFAINPGILLIGVTPIIVIVYLWMRRKR
jgi:hypothetical protein